MSSDWFGRGFVGPLAGFAPGFAHHLARQGYATGSICHQLRLLRLLSQWLLDRGLGVEKLHTDEVERFVAARRAAGYQAFRSLKAMRPALDYLRDLSVAPPPSTDVAVGPVNLLLERYRRYLLVERSLAPSSIRLYADGVRPFLDGRRSADGRTLDLATLTSSDIISYVVQFGSSRGNRSAKHIVKVLRSLLRFLHVEGIIQGALAAAVPSVSNRHLVGLPKGLDPEQVRRLLASCDTTTHTGRRDFAILTMLVRLGLRSIEVARLRLDDIDWRAGELIVHGKGNRVDRLPLPADVGAALVAYMENGRPAKVRSRSLFIYALAPYRSLDAGGVASLVQNAARRAGMRQVSPHRLRHTAATEMLRAGASLSEIGQVLRHSRAMTTAIYAKVDLAALRTIARPWPGDVA
jgi:site-specific recombinase XerD